MFITVLMTVCLDLSAPGSCVTTPVVNSNQDEVTMGSCMGLVGFGVSQGVLGATSALSQLAVQGLVLSDRQSRSARQEQGVALTRRPVSPRLRFRAGPS